MGLGGSASSFGHRLSLLPPEEEEEEGPLLATEETPFLVSEKRQQEPSLRV